MIQWFPLTELPWVTDQPSLRQFRITAFLKNAALEFNSVFQVDGEWVISMSVLLVGLVLMSAVFLHTLLDTLLFNQQ